MNRNKYFLITGLFSLSIVYSLNASNIVIGSSYISVKDAPYSAKGDYSTPDDIAINKAIKAVQDAGGGTVYFPKGNYVITHPLLIGDGVSIDSLNPAKCGTWVCLKGEGKGVSMLFSKSGEDVIRFQGGAVDGENNYSTKNIISGLSILKDPGLTAMPFGNSHKK